MLWQEVIGLFDFRCYLGCRFVEFDASIICHMLVYCFLLISIARYIFKSPRICFWGTKYDVYRERVVYLHCILLWRRARLWLELFASAEDKFFSRVSYLPSHVFLRRRRSFTSRKLYACLEKFLCLLQLSDRAKFLELDVQGSFSFDSSITTGFEITLNAQVCWLCCVLYMSLFGLVQAMKLWNLWNHETYETMKPWNLWNHET